MRVIDPGHKFAVTLYDTGSADVVTNMLTYMKREGPGYPGNVGHYPGTNLQEHMRAQISRIKYLDQQDPCDENKIILTCLRTSILLLEIRAARRHGASDEVLDGLSKLHDPINRGCCDIEYELTCPKCGHIRCNGIHRIHEVK